MKHIEGIKRMVDRQLEEGKREEEQKRKETSSLFAERSRVQIIIKGKVQGVFFRSFIEKEADRLKLSGFVQNRQDGSVEVVAEGEKGALEELVKFCEKGPRGSAVVDVTVKWSSFKGEFGNFLIRE